MLKISKTLGVGTSVVQRVPVLSETPFDDPPQVRLAIAGSDLPE
jgi:hypothetical protein